MTRNDHTLWRARSRRTAGVALAILCMNARSAHAYTDPGSGALLLQLGFAAVFGALFYVRRAVGWVKGLFVARGPDEPTA